MSCINFRLRNIFFVADDFQGWDDNDWGWKDENKISENKESVLLSWLQDCHISLSPAGDLLVLANDTRIVHLARKYACFVFDKPLIYTKTLLKLWFRA